MNLFPHMHPLPNFVLRGCRRRGCEREPVAFHHLRFRLTLVMLAGVLTVAAGPNSSAGAASAGLAGSRPNIVFILTDDQGYANVGRHGHPWLRTPHLDALHDAGTRFTHFYASPSCAPARAALLTGRHALKNGLTSQPVKQRCRIALATVLLPQVLKSAGYHTGIFGKWHVGSEDAYQPQRRGFDEALVFGGARMPEQQYFDPVLRHNGRFVRTRGFCTDVFFSAALGWIRERQRSSDVPFFAYISLNAPHRPYVAPASHVRRFKEFGFVEGVSRGDAGYYGMIENLDDNVGRLVDRLRSWGLLEKTVIVFMTDNGMPGDAYGLSEPGTVIGRDAAGEPLEAFNAGMRGFKGSVDEGGVRVPFFMRWDGRIPAGRAVDRIADHIDILPTLAALAGAPLPPGQVEGRSLLPLVEDPGAAARWPDRFLFLHRANWPLGANPDDYQWRNFSVRNQRFRYVNGDHLYDLAADPGQTRNVIAQHPSVAAEMREAFARFWREARPLMVNEDATYPAVEPFDAALAEQMRAGDLPEWRAPVW